jgi:hypothetical protein
MHLAIFSGYEMSPHDFKRFVFTLRPDMEHEPADAQLPNCIFAYDSWRRKLPESKSRMVPRLRRASFMIILSSQILQVRFKSNNPDASPDGLFFATRYVDFKGPRQLRAERLAIQTETPADRTKLAGFVQFVSECNATFDPARATFSFIQDIHPYCDDRLVCSYLIDN